MTRFLAVAALAALLAACGSEPSVSTTPAPTPTPSPLPSSVASAPLGASTPADAVRALLATGGPTICRPSTGPEWSQEAGCPVTTRLQRRLQSSPTSVSGGGTDPICRCRSIAPVSLAADDAGQPGGAATVAATFQFRPPLVIRFRTVQQAQGSGWLVDDIFCGDPSTSIYNDPVRPCPSSA